MKCIIMDYTNALIRVIDMPKGTDSEKAELILTEEYKYDLGSIYYMLADKFTLVEG